MRGPLVAAIFTMGLASTLVGAPTDVVTQADLQVLIRRITELERENKAQAVRIAELEKELKGAPAATEVKTSTVAAAPAVAMDEGTTTNESGRVYTTAKGYKYYLADASARIFEPLSESGFKFTPYAYLSFEGVYMDHSGPTDWTTDYLANPNGRMYEDQSSTLSMNDSIIGVRFETPETHLGWAFDAKLEFDLVGGNANEYGVHWRHAYVNAAHESGWSLLFGQTWHLWKIVTPNEIDGAWLEYSGHPYRRSPQFRVTRVWDFEASSLEWRVGVVKNGPGMGGDHDRSGVDDNSASAIPLFETAFVYEHDACWEEAGSGKRWLVGIGGMYGQDRFRDGAGDDKDDFDSMMALVAAKVPYGDFTLTGQFFGGENLGGVQGGVGQCYVTDWRTGEAKGVQTYGGFVDLAYEINRDWTAAIGYGFDHPTIGTDYVQGSGGLSESIYHNDRAYINIFYRITPNFRIGLEYARLNTCYAEDKRRGLEGGDAHANRVQFSAQYNL